MENTFLSNSVVNVVPVRNLHAHPLVVADSKVAKLAYVPMRLQEYNDELSHEDFSTPDELPLEHEAHYTFEKRNSVQEIDVNLKSVNQCNILQYASPIDNNTFLRDSVLSKARAEDNAAQVDYTALKIQNDSNGQNHNNYTLYNRALVYERKDSPRRDQPVSPNPLVYYLNENSASPHSEHLSQTYTYTIQAPTTSVNPSPLYYQSSGHSPITPSPNYLRQQIYYVPTQPPPPPVSPPFPVSQAITPQQPLPTPPEPLRPHLYACPPPAPSYNTIPHHSGTAVIPVSSPLPEQAVSLVKADGPVSIVDVSFQSVKSASETSLSTSERAAKNDISEGNPSPAMLDAFLDVKRVLRQRHTTQSDGLARLPPDGDDGILGGRATTLSFSSKKPTDSNEEEAVLCIYVDSILDLDGSSCPTCYSDSTLDTATPLGSVRLFGVNARYKEEDTTSIAYANGNKSKFVRALKSKQYPRKISLHEKNPTQEYVLKENIEDFNYSTVLRQNLYLPAPCVPENVNRVGGRGGFEGMRRSLTENKKTIIIQVLISNMNQELPVGECVVNLDEFLLEEKSVSEEPVMRHVDIYGRHERPMLNYYHGNQFIKTYCEPFAYPEYQKHRIGVLSMGISIFRKKVLN